MAKGLIYDSTLRNRHRPGSPRPADHQKQDLLRLLDRFRPDGPLYRERGWERGGKLYDKWYAVTGASAPDTMHPLYPSSGKYAAKPKSHWRCKECHGWDYRGADGAYKSGKHATGIKGIDGAAGRNADEIVALLKTAEHAYGDKLSDAELKDLAMFVSAGQVDLDSYIDRDSKMPIDGDAARFSPTVPSPSPTSTVTV